MIADFSGWTGPVRSAGARAAESQMDESRLERLRQELLEVERDVQEIESTFDALERALRQLALPADPRPTLTDSSDDWDGTNSEYSDG